MIKPDCFSIESRADVVDCGARLPSEEAAGLGEDEGISVDRDVDVDGNTGVGDECDDAQAGEEVVQGGHEEVNARVDGSPDADSNSGAEAPVQRQYDVDNDLSGDLGDGTNGWASSSGCAAYQGRNAGVDDGTDGDEDSGEEVGDNANAEAKADVEVNNSDDGGNGRPACVQGVRNVVVVALLNAALLRSRGSSSERAERRDNEEQSHSAGRLLHAGCFEGRTKITES